MLLSKRASANPESGIREMFDRARHYSNVINLGIGEPDYPTPDIIIESAINALQKGLTKYTPNAGILELREAVMYKLFTENRLKGTGEDNIIVTTGASEAIILSLFALTDPGDEVIVPVPCWPNYIGQITLAGLKPVPVETFKKDRFHIRCDSLKEAISPKTKAIIINSPSNPTGAVLSIDELEQIGRIAKENKLMIISDEPYEKLVYDEKTHFSIGAIDGMNGNVLTVNSFSKTYSMTGWRVGYIHGPKSIISKMAKLQENLSSCVNAPSQYACVKALAVSSGEIDKMRASYLQRRKIIVEGLNSLPGVSCLWPEGAFYVFPDVSALGRNSREIAFEWLDKCQVVTVPGSAFGSAGEGFLRLSFASGEKSINDAIERIRSFLEQG